MKDTVRPKPPHARPQESLALLKKELRHRGMSPAEIDSTLRKKHRRKQLEFDVVISKRIIPPEKRLPQKDARAREPRVQSSQDICTVDIAADLLGLHPKTVLRFIRTGRLPAKRVGKSWRIRRADLSTFAGVSEPAIAPSARMTSIIDIPNVGPQLAKKWSAAIAAALDARPGSSLSANLAHDPAHRQLKLVLIGSPAETRRFMSLAEEWLVQLS